MGITIGSYRIYFSDRKYLVAKNYSICIGCTEGDVKLLGGSTSLEGRVEICEDNMWATVCNYRWDYQEATVVCRQLELSIAGIYAYLDVFPW